jgi:hypothetical protein
MTQSNFPRLHPLLKIVRGLLKKGLMGEEILQTFLSCGVQPLHWQEVAIGMLLGLDCPTHTSFPQPGGAETDA